MIITRNPRGPFRAAELWTPGGTVWAVVDSRDRIPFAQVNAGAGHQGECDRIAAQLNVEHYNAPFMGHCAQCERQGLAWNEVHACLAPVCPFRRIS